MLAVARVRWPIAILFFSIALARTAFAAVAGDAPFEFRSGLIWINVVSGGQSLHFVLDSGAGNTVVDTQAARRLKVPLGAVQQVRTVEGTASAYEVNGFRADLNGIPIKDDALAVDLSKASRACGSRIDGLLGQDFFRGRIVQLDFGAKRLRVGGKVDPGCCCASVPLRFCNDAMCVPVSVAGSKPRWTRLDTGCDEGLQWVSTLPGMTKAARVSVGISQAGENCVRASVQVGDEWVPNVKTTLHRNEIFPGEAGLLGNGVLSKYRVTIDAINRRVFLER